MIFESKYLGVIDCSRCSNYTGNSAKIKEFDIYLDRESHVVCKRIYSP